MDKNYAVYPMQKMNITQNYNGKTSHLPHTTGTPKDYPWDEAGTDGGRDYMLCPCDKMKIVRIYGYGNRGANTIWLESLNKVYFADGTCDYMTIMVTHPNDDDVGKLKVGQIFSRGEKMFREGTDGYATGNHLHISVGKGKLGTNGGWLGNTNGKWVLTVTKSVAKPEEIFFVDKNKTTVKSTEGLTFKVLPKEVKYKVGNYIVDIGETNLLYVRKGPATTYSRLYFKDFTTNAQKQIKKLNGGKSADGYIKGVVFSATKINGEWGKTPSGWVCLKYCKAVK